MSSAGCLLHQLAPPWHPHWLSSIPRAGGAASSPLGRFVTAQGDALLYAPSQMHDYSTAADHWHLLWAHFCPHPAWQRRLVWPTTKGLRMLHLRGGEVRDQFRAACSARSTWCAGNSPAALILPPMPSRKLSFGPMSPPPRTPGSRWTRASAKPSTILAQTSASLPVGRPRPPLRLVRFPLRLSFQARDRFFPPPLPRAAAPPPRLPVAPPHKPRHRRDCRRNGLSRSLLFFQPLPPFRKVKSTAFRLRHQRDGRRHPPRASVYLNLNLNLN